MARNARTRRAIAGRLFPSRSPISLTLQALPLYYECLRSIPFNLFHMLAPVKKVLYVFDQEKSFAI
jgi:hypothetical protein